MYYILTIYIFLTLTNFILFAVGKRSRVIEIITLFFLVILMGGNTHCADFEDYQYWYESQEHPLVMEPGYKFLANTLSSYGVSFIGFRSTLFSLSFIIAFFAVRRMVSNFHLILFVYLSYMMVLDAVQIRNTIGISLLLLGMLFLSQSKRLRYLLCVLLASSFHFSFLLFLPLLFYRSIVHVMIRKEKLGLVVCAVLCMAALTGSLLAPLSSLVSNYWSDSKVDYYNSSSLLNLVYLVFPILYYYIAKISWKIAYRGDTNQIYEVYSCIVLGIGVIFLFLMPLLIMSRDSLRIFRDANIELVVVAAFALTSIRNTGKLKLNGGGYFMHEIQNTSLVTVHALDGWWAVCSRICRVIPKQYPAQITVSIFLAWKKSRDKYSFLANLIQGERRFAYA